MHSHGTSVSPQQLTRSLNRLCGHHALPAAGNGGNSLVACRAAALAAARSEDGQGGQHSTAEQTRLLQEQACKPRYATLRKYAAKAPRLTLARQHAHHALHRAAPERPEGELGGKACSLTANSQHASEVQRALLCGSAGSNPQLSGGQCPYGAGSVVAEPALHCDLEAWHIWTRQPHPVPTSARGAASTRVGSVQAYVSAWRGNVTVISPCEQEVGMAAAGQVAMRHSSRELCVTREA